MKQVCMGLVFAITVSTVALALSIVAKETLRNYLHKKYIRLEGKREV